MPVNFHSKYLVAYNSAPLIEDNELPNLLQQGLQRQSKTSHGKRKLAPESKSTGGMCGSLAHQGSKTSLETSKTLGAGSLDDCGSSEEHDASDLGHKAFPLKAAPLKRWRAAAKIQSYLSKFRKIKATSTEPETTVVEIKERTPQTWVQYWPEEPEAPTREDLDELTELESMLVESHGTMSAAYKFITNCVKNPGNVDLSMTKRELRIALHLKASKDAALQASPGCDRFEMMFDRLCTLLRKRGSEISRAEFLRFPELLSREKDLQARLLSSSVSDDDEDLLIGSRLRDRLMGRIQTPEQVLELLQKAAVALQLEPCRTTNVLFQVGSTSSSSGGSASSCSNVSGLKSAVTKIMSIAQLGAPSPGVKLAVLLAGWTLCDALVKQVISLGAPPAQSSPAVPSSTKSPIKPAKPCLTSKAKFPKLGKKYHNKVDFSTLQSSQDNHVNECNAAFWQALPVGEVLWNVGCGAEALNDVDFKSLLRTSWSLFDDFNGVDCLLGPVGWGRMRPKLDALAALNLEFGKGSEHVRSQLQNAGIILLQIASMCEADPRLARIAALFGASFLADRIRSSANGSVNFTDGAIGYATAQVNRSVEAVVEELRVHVEELLGGRKVECCLSGGDFKIVPGVKQVQNPLAEWHQKVTAETLANATVKGDNAHRGSDGIHKIRPCDKFLLGYSNLQGF